LANEKTKRQLPLRPGRLQVTAGFDHFHLCHCTQFQKATGSAHASNLFTKTENFAWLNGVELVKRYDMPGRTISQAFCTEYNTIRPHQSLNGLTPQAFAKQMASHERSIVSDEMPFDLNESLPLTSPTTA
jgi:hypothetical protein